MTAHSIIYIYISNNQLIIFHYKSVIAKEHGKLVNPGAAQCVCLPNNMTAAVFTSPPFPVRGRCVTSSVSTAINMCIHLLPIAMYMYWPSS